MELKEIIRGLVRESIKESLSEMSQNDVHFKNIMRLYDHGGSFTKKKVAVAVCKNPNASRAKIIDYLLDTDYNEILDIQNELNMHEALVKEAQGRIPKLFLKIEAVKKELDKLTAERKSKFGGEYAKKVNAEKDPKKRDALVQPILAISKKITAQSIMVYVSGDNLITWTKYEGNDPERAGSGRFAQFPQLRIYTAGVKVKF